MKRPSWKVVLGAGTLLVLGAGTGTTFAMWTGLATLAASSVSSGTIALNVNGSASATLTGPTGLEPGGAQTLTATIANASPAAAKNLWMQVALTSVTSSNRNLDGNVEVAATTVASPANCVAAIGVYKPVGATYTTTTLGGPMAPQTSTTLCLSVRLAASPSAASRGQSGTLTLTFTGQQVRP